VTTKVEVPSVGESVTEAILVKWHKQSGDYVQVDEPLCELETDKANVDEVIAELDESASASAGGGAAQAAASPAPEPAAPPPAPAAPAPSSGNGASPPAGVDLGDFRPAVRALIQEHGLDPSKIQGTGPSGAITKEDVKRHMVAATSVPAAPPPSAVAVSTPAPAPARREDAPVPVAPPKPAPSKGPSRPPIQRVEISGEAGGERREPMSKLRRRIASRLVAAQQETAMLTTFNEVDLTEVKALRAKYKEKFAEEHGVKLGFMSFFAKAAALSLMEYPAVNGKIDGDEIVYHDFVNIGVAVSTDRGLVVPVIKGIERMSMWQIESEIKRVAFAARDGKLGLDEMSGGTFTVTNGGVFGSLMSTPILNRPQSGILGMHAIQDRPMAVNGQVLIRPMMYVALSYDHRIIDGRESVSFLVRMKQYLEEPARMLLQV
jgi:2-oxoglutarate dehydrogenase E2 component (dihydrolipoamide succinyltransferase)